MDEDQFMSAASKVASSQVMQYITPVPATLVPVVENIAPPPAVSYADPAPGVELIPPAVSYVTPAPVGEYMALLSAVDDTPEPVVEDIASMSAVYAVPHVRSTSDRH